MGGIHLRPIFRFCGIEEILKTLEISRPIHCTYYEASYQLGGADV